MKPLCDAGRRYLESIFDASTFETCRGFFARCYESEEFALSSNGLGVVASYELSLICRGLPKPALALVV